MKLIDNILNRVTMYRLLVYGLGAIALIAIFFAALGLVHFDPAFMLLSLIVLLVSVFLSEYLLSVLRNRPMNHESWLITALILFLILPPAREIPSVIPLALAGFLASLSKFLLAWRGKHIFNPAAFAAAVLSLTTLWPASWWIGSNSLWWLALIFGLLVIRKIRHVTMVLWFAVVAIAVQIVQFMIDGQLSATNVQHMLIASPLIFLATIMLTEPATMPPRRGQQYIFVTIAGVLYATGFSFGSFYVYPEVALLLANLYAFVVTPKLYVAMKLEAIEDISDTVKNFVFRPKRRFTFIPGQYVQWTLPRVALDSRGNRRTFTIASSPTEDRVMIGVKFYQPSSNYKKYLRAMQPGAIIYASQLAGSFTLPQDKARKLLFIAGGIGITPFRSMIRAMLDTGDMRDAVLVYAVSSEAEFAYVDVLNEARQRGITVHPVVGGVLTGDLLRELVPDMAERLAYISGPNVMVDGVKKSLRHLGVHPQNVRTDHFSGY